MKNTFQRVLYLFRFKTAESPLRIRLRGIYEGVFGEVGEIENWY